MHLPGGGDHLTPVLRLRPWPSPSAPGALENCVEQKHRHVAANTIALAGDTGKRFSCGPAKFWPKRIQLQHILPRRKVGIFPTGVNGPFYLNVGCGVIPGVLSTSWYEVFRVFDAPRMVGCHVVRHEIQDQPQTSLRQFLSGSGKALRATQVLVDLISPNRICGSDVVLPPKIRQGAPEIVHQGAVLIGNGSACRAALPDAHQPNGIEAVGRYGIPLG